MALTNAFKTPAVEKNPAYANHRIMFLLTQWANYVLEKCYNFLWPKGPYVDELVSVGAHSKSFTANFSNVFNL